MEKESNSSGEEMTHLAHPMLLPQLLTIGLGGVRWMDRGLLLLKYSGKLDHSNENVERT